MSHKVVTERMVYMVTEYEFYEELKDAVENGLRNDIENLSVRIIERREFEKTDFKLCLAVLCGSVVELRVMADEWYDPAAHKFDFQDFFQRSGMPWTRSMTGMASLVQSQVSSFSTCRMGHRLKL